MAVDKRVLHARTGWIARIAAGGALHTDFMEVTNSIEQWRD